ncbi:HNH/ENDO VII family nuclease, partial [Gilliamella apis]
VTSLQELASQVKELERTIHKDAGKDSKDGKMGNDFSKGVDSAVAIITSIITGDIAGGLAGASAPWLAEQIKLHTGDNEAARLIAHSILGAVVAELQGNSGLAGGAGAVVGEIAADIIRKQLYGKEVKDLTEEEKETISALSQLASGLAVAAGGGNIGDASAAISSSKNAVENNYVNVGLAMVKAAEAVCNGDKACEQQVIKEGIDSYNEMIIEGGTLQVIVLGTLIVAPAAIAAAEAGMAACSVNPVLCANQVAIWVMETIGAEAMPAAGLGMSAAELAKSLSKAQLKELSALMAMEKSGELTPGLAKKLKEFLNKTPETNIVTKGSSATNKVVVNEKGLENAGKGTNSATQADAAKYFGQERKYWSKDPIEFNGNKVYQRNDLFDPNLMTTWTDKGKIIEGTNLERMASGRAPIGHDGNPINLHHMTQNKNGAIAEVTQTFHQQNKTVIHVNPNTIPSGINRGEFNKWKTQYWIERAKTYR